MNYSQSLAYLYSLQRFGIKLGLDNITKLLGLLEHPQTAYPCVHVAGTNGKGTVCATLAAILSRGGYRVGMYTSPHLHSFTERIQVNDRPISEEVVVSLTEEIRSLAVGIPVTFFEFTTAMALAYFQKEQVDLVILETGLGGRLDATNVVNPVLSIITPVSLDHTEHLGETLAVIAAEKAGVIKPEAPVLIGKQPLESLKVLLEQAESRNAPVWLQERDFSFVEESSGGVFSGFGQHLGGLQPGLCGKQNAANQALALAAVLILSDCGFVVPRKALVEGFCQVSWPGRMEWWHGGSAILLDGAHNPAGSQVLAEFLQEVNKPVRLVFGLKGQRQVDAILGPLLPRCREIFCVSPPIDDAVDPREIAAVAGKAEVPAETYKTVALAMEAALGRRRSDEILVVAGSLFLVAAAREHLLNTEAKRAS